MREIKFRTWNPTGKEMNYVKKVEYMGGTGFYDQSLDHENNIWMEWTGLKDRKGKEIYEGDIIRSYNDFGEAFEELTVVEYDTESARWFGVLWEDLEHEEVVGNIHEHPHLLKGEEA